MKIKEIEQQKCGKCPLIDFCGDAFESPCLCCEPRLEEVDVDVYKTCVQKMCYSSIKEKAFQLGLVLAAPNDISEDEKDDWEEENNCYNNYKLATMELFLDNPIMCSFEEWNQA